MVPYGINIHILNVLCQSLHKDGCKNDLHKYVLYNITHNFRSVPKVIKLWIKLFPIKCMQNCRGHSPVSHQSLIIFDMLKKTGTPNTHTLRNTDTDRACYRPYDVVFFRFGLNYPKLIGWWMYLTGAVVFVLKSWCVADTLYVWGVISAVPPRMSKCAVFWKMKKNFGNSIRGGIQSISTRTAKEYSPPTFHQIYQIFHQTADIPWSNWNSLIGNCNTE